MIAVRQESSHGSDRIPPGVYAQVGRGHSGLATRCIGRRRLPPWPSSTPSSSRSASDPRPGWSWRGASSGRSASSGTPPTSRSTACSPGWRPTAGSTSSRSRQTGRPDKKVYAVSPAGRAGARRLAGRADRRSEALRSELAVKLRGASYGDRARRARRGPRATSPTTRPGWRTTEQLRARDYPDPPTLDRRRRSTSTSCCAAASAWRSSGSTGSTEYLHAHETTPTDERMTTDLPPPARADHPRRRSTLRNRVVMGSMHTGLEDRALGPRRAGGVLRRARPRRRRPDHHRRLRAQQARLAQAVRLRDDHPAAGDAAPRGHRRGARRGRRDRAAGAARRPLRLPPVQRRARRDTKSPITPFKPHALSTQGRRPHRHRLRASRSRWPARRATTRSRSWAPRAT